MTQTQDAQSSATAWLINPALKKALHALVVPDLLSMLGGLVFFSQLAEFIHTQVSGLDEGMFLFEGYLFSIGRYIPYQDFGIRMYQLPLAYLIPGYIQRWFGPGLRTGRYFAVLLACLMLLALWIAARRLGGAWLASGAVWIIALNPALAKLYSQADSQGLAAGLLMGSMAFSLGEKRPAWQISIGSFLCGALILVRVNLLPVLPLLVLYIFWQYGWRMALLSTASALLPLIGMHLLYWPNILRIWAYWLPEGITPFLNSWRPPSPEILSKIPSFIPRLNSFTYAFRVFFATIVGIWATWIAWPPRKDWKSESNYRTAVFLSVLFIVLALMHIWASVLINNCIFCLTGYLSFFIGLGVLLVVVGLSSWSRVLPAGRQRLGILVSLALLAALGFNLQLVNGLNKVLPVNAADYLLNLKSPVGHAHRAIYVYIANMLDIPPDLIFRTLNGLISAMLGIIAGGLLILIVWKASELLLKIRFFRPYPTSLRLFALLIILGLILSPTRILSGSYHTYDCSSNVIVSMEAAGAHLRQVIPPNALVNYDGPDSPAPLLYIPDVRIFPAQLTGAYEWREGGDPTALARYGLWDLEMAQKYLAQSDYAIAWKSYLATWEKNALFRSGNYNVLPSSPPVYPCYPNIDTSLMIFKRLK